MATSGTTTFNLDISDIMEEAYDLCGLELRSGYSYRGAKRALNLVFLEWQNKGLNLWTIEQGSATLVAGTSSYTAESSALDIVDVSIRTNAGNVDDQFDQRLNRISRTEYNHQASKLTQSKPTQFYVDKDNDAVKIVLWATPDSAETYTLIYDYVKRIEDVGTVASNNADVPTRYLPCLTYALAYNLACKSPEAIQRVPMIRQRYMELWDEVSEADREKAAVKFVPDLSISGY
jgi:hypothetical protein|tara:strand:- start:1265 stop:1963 length:699 start_codon:yes stop_codon:yes gene_type:complete